MFIYFVMLVQSLMASGTHIVAKLVVRDVEPVTLTFLRSFMAAVALYGFARVRGIPLTFDRADWGRILFLSILAIPLNQFLFLTAMRYTTAANAALLYGTTPAMVLIISTISGSEKLSSRKTVGVATAFAGILIIVFERGIELRSDYTFGNILLVIAVFSWALYTVFGRPLILRYGAFPTSAITMIIGMLVYFPIGIYNTVIFPLHQLTLPDWAGLVYLSLFTSIFAYFLWYYALGKIEASKVAIFSNLQPILTTIMAVFILGQQISSQFIAGGVIALIGVVLTQFG